MKTWLTQNIEHSPFFSKSYTKYFFASIARLYAKEKQWFRKQNLYSVREIPFESLRAAVAKVCRLDASTSENVFAIQAYIAISRETAVIALSNWKNTPAGAD